MLKYLNNSNVETVYNIGKAQAPELFDYFSLESFTAAADQNVLKLYGLFFEAAAAFRVIYVSRVFCSICSAAFFLFGIYANSSRFVRAASLAPREPKAKIV